MSSFYDRRKKYSQAISHFALWGSGLVKSAHKMWVKSTPDNKQILVIIGNFSAKVELKNNCGQNNVKVDFR